MGVKWFSKKRLSTKMHRGVKNRERSSAQGRSCGPEFGTWSVFSLDGTDLDKCAFCATNEILELVRHRRDNVGLDGNQQILLGRVVLENDRERIVNFTLHATQGSKEARHRLRSSEKNECLVDRVASCFHPTDISRADPRSQPVTSCIQAYSWIGYSAIGFCLTKTKGHALPRRVLFAGHTCNPRWIVDIVVYLGFFDRAQNIFSNQVLKGLKVSVLK